MDLSQAHTQSFIVKIWVEETAENESQSMWRGHITHVPSGQRFYFESLAKIKAFMKPYLEEMGVDLNEYWWRR